MIKLINKTSRLYLIITLIINKLVRKLKNILIKPLALPMLNVYYFSNRFFTCGFFVDNCCIFLLTGLRFTFLSVVFMPYLGTLSRKVDILRILNISVLKQENFLAFFLLKLSWRYLYESKGTRNCYGCSFSCANG